MIGKVRMGLAALALMALPAVADEKREFKWSFNGGITTDYVFRGFSQTAERPTGQAGIDLSYGIAYFGIWGSGLDFGLDGNNKIARAEIDFYAGIKPVWQGITFDLGVIYYAYPNAFDRRTVITGELDYVELKFGMSREIWKDGTLASTYYYSPDYTNDTGRVFTSETSFTQALGAHHGITPSISALVGYQKGNAARYRTLVANGDDNYWYWNAGLTLGWEKFSADFRYWDTNVKNNGAATGFCTGTTFQCDERFVMTFKFTY
jgi:uncharacterized protein (TIGR02001 family)